MIKGRTFSLEEVHTLQDFYYRMDALFEKYDNPYSTSKEYQYIRSGFILLHDITSIKLKKIRAKLEQKDE